MRHIYLAKDCQRFVLTCEKCSLRCSNVASKIGNRMGLRIIGDVAILFELLKDF